MFKRSKERWLLFALLAGAFFLRVWELGRESLWYDEILQAQIAGGPLADFFPQLILHAAMPLDYLIERVVLALGANEFLLRFPAAAFSTLAVAAMYRVGRIMFGRTVGILAAAFLAVSSFAIFYAHEARPYSLYLLCALASFYWLYRALQANKFFAWLLYGVFLGAAVLAHLFALFVAVAQAVFLVSGLLVRAFAPARAPLFSKITHTALVGVLVVALFFFAALWLTPNAQFVWGSAQRFLAFLLAPNFTPPTQTWGLAPGETIPQLSLDFFYTRILENFSGGGFLATFSFVALGVLGLTEFREKKWETLLLFFWAILPSALIFLFLFYRATLFASRYLIASLPAWLLLVAVGTCALATWFNRLTPRNHFLRGAAPFVLAMLFVVISLERATVALALPKEDWRTTGQLLDANVRAGDTVVTPGGTRVVLYYAPTASQFHNAAELAPQITDVEHHAARVWLVMNRYVFDPGAEIQAWLEGRGAVALRVDDGITVYYWRAGADNAALLGEAKNFALPESAFPYASLAEQSARDGDYSTAEHYFARARALAKTRAQTAMVNLAWGQAARRAGNPEDAAEKFRAALAADANLVDAWNGLGRAYLEQNQLPAARDALAHALALDTQSYPALFFLAAYYERAGDNATAQAYSARAAAIIPELTTPP